MFKSRGTRDAKRQNGIGHHPNEQVSDDLPLGDVYRQLFNPELYLHSYSKLYRNDGAMTKGVTAETVDGMSLGKIRRDYRTDSI